MTDTNLSFDLNISGTEKGPKYLRLLRALESAIRDGKLSPGTKLPTVRDLAYRLGITPGTVARAYRIATEDGLLEATTGRGTFVKNRMRPVADIPENSIVYANPADVLNLRTGHTLDVGQTELIKETLQHVLSQDVFSLAQYVRDHALEGCRKEAQAWMASLGISCRAEDVVLTNGGHNAVMVALAATVSRQHPVVAVPNLTYPGFRQSAHVLRANMVGVRTDADGIDPEDFARICIAERPAALILSSNADNPTTAMLPPDRREAIASLAERFDVQIIDDDVYGTLIGERPEGFDTLCPHRTWTAVSLSKCFAAGMRVGFLACPPGKGQTGVRLMQGFSLAVPQPMTSVVERLFADGKIAEVREIIAQENTARVGLARNILNDWTMDSRDRLSFLWLHLPPGWTSSAFVAAAAAQKISVTPGDSFALPGGTVPHAVRLTLNAPSKREDLADGLRRLDALLRQPQHSILA